MYTNVQDRLNDYDFFTTSVNGKEKRGINAVIGLAQEQEDSPIELDEKQAQCYLKRYEDVRQSTLGDVVRAQEHWKATGRNQGRDSSCEFTVMTTDEASCYLYRYHELAAKFGTNNTEKAL